MIISRSIQKQNMRSRSLQIYLAMIASTYSFLCVPTDPVTTTTSTAVQQQREQEENQKPQPQFQNQQSTIRQKKDREKLSSNSQPMIQQTTI